MTNSEVISEVWNCALSESKIKPMNPHMMAELCTQRVCKASMLKKNMDNVSGIVICFRNFIDSVDRRESSQKEDREGTWGLTEADIDKDFDPKHLKEQIDRFLNIKTKTEAPKQQPNRNVFLNERAVSLDERDRIPPRPKLEILKAIPKPLRLKHP